MLSLYSNFTSKKCHDQAHGKARLLKHIENISKPFFPSEELVNFSMGLEKSHTKALFFFFLILMRLVLKLFSLNKERKLIKRNLSLQVV